MPDPSRYRATIVLASLLFFACLGPIGPVSGQEQPIAVDPADIARRDDLVGKLILVDDRIRFFQNHPKSGYDELYLRRTPIPFRLPVELRPDTPPRAQAASVQARLSREGSSLVADVTALTIQPPDLERLDKAVSSLAPTDYENRKAWARWAEGRANSFKDDALRNRAKAVEADALRVEAESRRLGVDAPREWLTLAEKARAQKVPEPAPSALAHRAFRAMLAAAKPTGLEPLRVEVERFFPEAAKDAQAASANLGGIGERYEKDPASAYREADLAQRRALDRKLWADVLERSLEEQSARDVSAAVQVVDRARSTLPERPDLASRLIERTQAQARRDLAALKLAEAKTVADLLQGRTGRPEDAHIFLRDWLDARRTRLGSADAEGRVGLAAQYDDLIQDAETARDLLEQAWKIDRGSAEISEAFRSRGYSRVGDDWVKEAPATAAAPAPSTDGGLLNKTPDEVRALLPIEPSSKSFSASRGRLIEQWIYNESRQRRCINFLHTPNSLKPRVISDSYLPR